MRNTRILDCAIGLVIGLGVLLTLRDTPTHAQVEYHDDLAYVIEQTNRGSRLSLSDASFESPACVQWALKECYKNKDIDHPEIFKAWDNAYLSFRDSGLYDKSFSYKDGVASLSIKSDLYEAEFDGTFIHISGVVTPRGLIVQLGNDYELVTDKYTSVSVKSCDVLLAPFEVLVSGQVDGLLQTFKSLGQDISFMGSLVILSDDLPECESGSDGYLLDTSYNYVIRRCSDGLEVAYGWR